MTCIVGYKDKDGTIHLGADSAAVDEHHALTVRLDEKVYVNGDFIIGFAGSFRMGQLLRYALHIPGHPNNKDDMEYLVVDFIDAVRDTLRDKGILQTTDHVETVDGEFIIGYNGNLYHVQNDLQIGVCDDYVCIGCGSDYAAGSMFENHNRHDMSSSEKIIRALKAAQYHSGGVREPFNVIQLMAE